MLVNAKCFQFSDLYYYITINGISFKKTFQDTVCIF